MVDRIEEPALLGGSAHAWLLAVIVASLVSGLVTLILLIKCCRKGGATKESRKAAEVVKARPDILPPSLSFDNKLTASLGAGEAAYMEQGAAGWRGEAPDYAHYPRPEEYLGAGHYRGPPDGGAQDYRGEYRGEYTGQQEEYRGEVGEYRGDMGEYRGELGEYQEEYRVQAGEVEQYLSHAGDQYAVPSKLRGARGALEAASQGGWIVASGQ